MKKENKDNALSFEKFQISKIKSPKYIIGGNIGQDDDDNDDGGGGGVTDTQ